MTDEQRDNTLVFLKFNTEELARPPDERGIQAVADVRFAGLPSNKWAQRGGNPVRVIPKSAERVASNLSPKFENYSGQVKDGFKSIEDFRMKPMGINEPKKLATFIAIGGIATALWFERESFSSDRIGGRLQENLVYKVESLWSHC